MSTLLRILSVEDSPSDSGLMQRPFLAAGYQLAWTRVETAAELREALEHEQWDVVLADYSMPQFDAIAALKLFQRCGLDIPFIVVSGAIGEDLGIAMMQAGAHDYVLKTQLGRLVPAVERELRETRVRHDRRIALERLRESEQRFRQLAEVTPNLVWQSGEDGTLEFVNQPWREYFGRNAAGFSPQHWAELVHRDDAGRALRVWGKASGDPAVNLDPIEVRLRRHDGTYRWFIGRSAAVRDGDNRVRHWVHTATDIHGIKEQEEALKRANAQLKQFAYAAAHDLIEPLRNISSSLGLLERLYERHPEPEPRALIEEASGDARRLHGMLRGLYELTRIDAANSTAALASTEEAMREVTANLRTAIAESGAAVSNGPLPSVAVRPVHLVQLLQNLIANALKFRDRDRPLRVSVTAEPYGREWLFTVADNGTGFDPSQSGRIFELFHRAHPGQASGTGVGLALCSRIVESYGGTIWAEGRPGEGATLRFTLPGASQAEIAAAPEAAFAGA